MHENGSGQRIKKPYSVKRIEHEVKVLRMESKPGVGEYMAWINFCAFMWYRVVFAPEGWFPLAVTVIFLLMALYVTSSRGVKR